jgi:hypothetical protein
MYPSSRVPDLRHRCVLCQLLVEEVGPRARARDEVERLPPCTGQDAAKKDQWAAFIKQVAVDPGSLTEVTETLAGFLMPKANKARALK